MLHNNLLINTKEFSMKILTKDLDNQSLMIRKSIEEILKTIYLMGKANFTPHNLFILAISKKEEFKEKEL